MALGAGVSGLARTAAKVGFVVADFPYRRRPGPRVLIYHQVGSGLGRQMEVTVEAFEYQLEWMRRNGSFVTLAEAMMRCDEEGSDRFFCLTFDDGYRDLYTTAYPRLADAGIPFTIYVTTAPVESGVPSLPGGAADPLTWDQLAEMADDGATIGSHTHTHPDLRHISPDAIEEELSTCDDLIEERLGVRSVDFCYPYGHWSATSDALVRSRYRTATLGAGKPLTTVTPPHLIHRVPVQLSDGPMFFRRKMKSGLVLEERVRRMLSGYRGP